MSDAFDCETSVEMSSFGVQQEMFFAVKEMIPEKKEKKNCFSHFKPDLISFLLRLGAVGSYFLKSDLKNYNLEYY